MIPDAWELREPGANDVERRLSQALSDGQAGRRLRCALIPEGVHVRSHDPFDLRPLFRSKLLPPTSEPLRSDRLHGAFCPGSGRRKYFMSPRIQQAWKILFAQALANTRHLLLRL